VIRRASVLLSVLVVALCVAGAAAQTPAAAPDLKALINNLSSLDYASRTSAARLIRRVSQAQAVPALVEAVRRHPDEYVRNRAFILLTGFNDRGTADLAKGLIADKNDRLRESVFKWFEQHPDPGLVPTLLGALQTEVGEFVRPALIGALTAVDQDQQVQRALVVESGRGLDFFRSAVIDVLGRRHALYAVDAIAPLTRDQGPLQQDAILAIGRIGGPKADGILAAVTGATPEVQMTVRAAACLAGKNCQAPLTALADVAGRDKERPAVIRAALDGLSAIAESGNAGTLRTLLDLAGRVTALHDEVALRFSAIALRRPSIVLDWFDSAPQPSRDAAYAILKDGFDSLDDDYAEEQFFAAARAMYWQAADNSPTRTVAAAIIQRLEF
jgi:HEAT repeat protein